MWKMKKILELLLLCLKGGQSKVMDSKMINNFNHFCWLSSDVMRKWVERYEHAKASKQRERASVLHSMDHMCHTFVI